MANRVRADYDELAEIAKRFEGESGKLHQRLDAVSRQVDGLEGGDWIGAGARAFYREMHSEVLPALQRLVRALEAAGRITRQSSQTMKQAEDDSSSLFQNILRTGGARTAAGGDDVVDALRSAGATAMNELAGDEAGPGAGGAASGLGTGAAETPASSMSAGSPSSSSGSGGGGGGSSGESGGGSAGGGGGGGSWSGEIGFKPAKPKPGTVPPSKPKR